jgi:hypothetical protein
MTDTIKPPLDYPHDEWQDSGDYYVPEDLRPFYAVAEPTPQEMDTYMHGGVEVAKPYMMESRRGIGSLYGDMDPRRRHRGIPHPTACPAQRR